VLLCLAWLQVVEVVVCRLSELQRQLYEHFLLSNATRRLLAGSKVRQGAQHTACTRLAIRQAGCHAQAGLKQRTMLQALSGGLDRRDAVAT
jgi:hypothetical protein